MAYVPGILAMVWGARERDQIGKARTGFICGIIGALKGPGDPALQHPGQRRERRGRHKQSQAPEPSADEQAAQTTDPAAR